MKRFDKAVAVDVIKELANEVCAKYVKYFIDNDISTDDKENEMVNSYWKMVDMEHNKAYECNTESKYNELVNLIKKVREEIDAAIEL